MMHFKEGKRKKSASDLFGSTHKYYSKYRPEIPEEVINIIINYFGVKKSDRILDIGCGTGQVAIAMEEKCGEMVCLDPDPEMLKQARKATKGSQMKLVWINYGSQDLGKIKEDLGTFKVATISRAFHWMNQEEVLNDLNDIIEKDGGIAIFGDGGLWTGEERWQKAIRDVIQKYLGEERRAGKGVFKQPKERWEDIIARSPFERIEKQEVRVTRNWNVETITGLVLSSSFASPNQLGTQLPVFIKDIEKTLLSINPRGNFKEKAVFSIILASRGKLPTKEAEN